MKLIPRLLILPLLIASPAAFTESVAVDGRDLEPTSIDAIAAQIEPGDILVVGEVHDQHLHQKNQIALIRALQERNLTVSVGMEFFAWQFQSQVDAYVTGQLDEASFLSQIEWGQNDFDRYRWQVLLPRLLGGTTYAINASRRLTGKVARSGLASLNDSERALLPEGFELGNDGYLSRFAESMQGHLSPEQLENYFAAQSIWDDTMADRACRAQRSANPGVLLIVVGDFHVAYSGGLPDRIRSRGCGPVRVISQIALETLEDYKNHAEVKPSPAWGPRGDWLILTQRD